MRQNSALDSYLKQLSESWKEYLASGNPRDKLARIREIRFYIREILQALEPLENQAKDAVRHGAARKMIVKYGSFKHLEPDK